MKGRKGKYETYIEPQLERIKTWAQTATEKDICKHLHIGTASWNTYKKEHKELRDAIIEGQQNLIVDLRSALIKKAIGYKYEEKVTVNRGDTLVETTYIKVAHPDTGAIHLLLKNYDKENWNDNWNNFDLRKKEIELKEKVINNQLEGW